MRCEKCNGSFPEPQIESSHDVPCYLFLEGLNRKERKHKADKFPRHWLCRECHLKYEDGLNQSLKIHSVLFSKKFFGGDDEK